MVPGNLTVPGRPAYLENSRQGPIALAVDAAMGGYGHFSSRLSFISLSLSLSLSLWETTRYRLKYCLKGPLNPKQPNNHL